MLPPWSTHHSTGLPSGKSQGKTYKQRLPRMELSVTRNLLFHFSRVSIRCINCTSLRFKPLCGGSYQFVSENTHQRRTSSNNKFSPNKNIFAVECFFSSGDVACEEWDSVFEDEMRHCPIPPYSKASAVYSKSASWLSHINSESCHLCLFDILRL